ncbi:MAG: AmmeMemoRadiSam system protein B [Candidatus Methanoplasma sp.]|jgi:AmmeMemoRadiSam system protein B|nr:AmmeMemoRadiSam system protein B [Candidatus Methanoplasma sp.]
MRPPAVAGTFYPADAPSLIREIEASFSHRLGPGMPGPEGDSRLISAAVCPHAGYMASGMNAAHAYRRILEDGLPDAYVIVGPDHRGVPYDAVMCGEGYRTPLGACEAHEGISRRLSRLVPDDPRAHAREHSIEVQVPFIQYIDPDPRIVTVVMRDQSLGAAMRLAAALREACEGEDVVMIASSDMAHYIPKREAARLNALVLDRLAAADAEGMYREIRDNRVSVCGYGPMAAALMFSGAAGAEVLAYSDSWDSLGGDPGAVVGYGSAVMRGARRRGPLRCA